ncbi:MAG: hypothetical protein DWQ34_18535 [Planctomycetota bacterium]|nr:MAG: hypothetical protein DWQ34_18535 [Planctomycetota bacterium]REK21272.1 MAG: hypothetical protein DWQ41_21960 [Planctomycetota bacterium]REK32065.1 MAG: hypothetical protein DWQ45_18050 [Planctomycetota bacterium]
MEADHQTTGEQHGDRQQVGCATGDPPGKLREVPRPRVLQDWRTSRIGTGLRPLRMIRGVSFVRGCIHRFERERLR